MEVLLNEIKESLKNPKKKKTISKATQYENKSRFHTECFMSTSEIQATSNDFLNWVGSLIPKDKFNIFLNLYKFPVLTLSETDSIYKELERVFDGKNASENYQFYDSETEEDWQDYKMDSLNQPDFWKQKAWEMVKTSINSVMIIDLPKEQEGEKPEPYVYFLDIKNVIDYTFEENKITSIIFTQDDGSYVYIDKDLYFNFNYDQQEEVIHEISTSEHDLGYCPANFFWNTPLNNTVPEIKKSPISHEVSNLDWLLFFSISKRHLDLYAPYPIYSTYETDCDFEDHTSGDYCEGGFIKDLNDQYKIFRTGEVMKCPVCSTNKLSGVGSYIEVPIPTDETPDLRDPVNITTIDSASLNYNVEEVKRLEERIFASCLGTGGETDHKQSMNEMQVSANFESRSSVLNSLKVNLEKAITFANETICKLRYGQDFISSSVSLGTEFYIYSVEDLYKKFNLAKDNGANDSELSAINEKIIETEYKNDSSQLQRMLILNQLEPYSNFTFSEIMEMHSKDLVDIETVIVKLNFSTFVSRFERENTNVIEFGKNASLENKIKAINNKFLDYVKEKRGKQESGSANDSGNGNQSGSGSEQRSGSGNGNEET